MSIFVKFGAMKNITAAVSFNRNMFFLFIPALNLTCFTEAVPGHQTFDCPYINRPVSAMCSYDGGPAENCILPLEVDIDRFGTDNHTVVITLTDEFEQSFSVSFNFALTERELELCSVCS